MRLKVARVTRPFAKALQRAYARVIRSGAPRVPHTETEGSLGGSLARDVLREDLVTHKRWGFVFTPSRLGLRFVVWWRGSKRQQARGRRVAINTQELQRELEDELARQVEAEDRRSG